MCEKQFFGKAKMNWFRPCHSKQLLIGWFHTKQLTWWRFFCREKFFFHDSLHPSSMLSHAAQSELVQHFQKNLNNFAWFFCSYRTRRGMTICNSFSYAREPKLAPLRILQRGGFCVFTQLDTSIQETEWNKTNKKALFSLSLLGAFFLFARTFS